MEPKETADLSKYSYEELMSIRQLISVPAFAAQSQVKAKDIDAEIERRATPKEEANPKSTNPQKEEDGEQEGVSV